MEYLEDSAELKQEIKFLENEFWYGGAVGDGYYFPLSKDDSYSLDISANDTYNQINPVYLSSKGRYIWIESGGKITFDKGKIIIDAPQAEVSGGGGTLKDAALNAAKKHYPPSGKMLDRQVFERNIYCSWIAFDYNQSQSGVLSYAESIIAKGLEPGFLIIDDGWQEDYGSWEFNRRRFPDPDAMVKRLGELGFEIILWLVPYVSADSLVFRELEAKDALLKNKDGEVIICKWWSGYSAALDFTTSAAKEFFDGQVKYLKSRYNAKGFKLDGGDAQFYSEEIADRNLHNLLWVKSIGDDTIKEMRACYKHANKPVMQRLADKAHSWTIEHVKDEKLPDGGYIKVGLSAVVPNILMQGLIGYAFGCPDMVGGGLFSDFTDKDNLDSELLIRSCQASVTLPIIQFSMDIWNIEKDNVSKLCKDALALRKKLMPYLLSLAKKAGETGEPIVRYMEYEFPNLGFEKITSQYMLGDRYLIAPITEKGAREKRVVFPEGAWKDIADGKIYGGGESVLSVDITSVPVFERIN